MSEKTYVKGNAKEHVFQDGGSVLNISIDASDIDKSKLVKGKYLNISISRRKEVGQYGDTHSMIYNEYKPKNADGMDQTPPEEQAPTSQQDSENLQF